MPLILILALLGTDATAARSPSAKPCVKVDAELIRRDAPKPTLRKLGELPPAKPFYTVLREIDGCPQNVVVPAHTR